MARKVRAKLAAAKRASRPDRFIEDGYSSWKFSKPPGSPDAGVQNYDPEQPRDESGKWSSGGGGTSATLADGRTLHFVPHPAQSQWETMVMVDPRKLDAAIPAYDRIDEHGHGQVAIPGRREQVTEFLKTGQPVQASQGLINQDGTFAIRDGRHRFSTLRDLGASAVGMTVPKEDAKEMIRRFGRDADQALLAKEEAARRLPEPAVQKEPPPGFWRRLLGGKTSTHNYDPDQPRDDSGKWSGGSSGDVGSYPKGFHVDFGSKEEFTAGRNITASGNYHRGSDLGIHINTGFAGDKSRDEIPSVGHIEVERPGGGHGALSFMRSLQGMWDDGWREFRTTELLPDGKKLFDRMEKTGLIKDTGRTHRSGQAIYSIEKEPWKFYQETRAKDHGPLHNTDSPAHNYDPDVARPATDQTTLEGDKEPLRNAESGVTETRSDLESLFVESLPTADDDLAAGVAFFDPDLGPIANAPGPATASPWGPGVDPSGNADEATRADVDAIAALADGLTPDGLVGDLNRAPHVFPLAWSELSSLSREELLSVLADAAFASHLSAPTGVQNYNPDQMRDERGRWTAGGGSGLSAADHERNRSAAADAVRAFAKASGPATEDEVRTIAGHLAKLTVAQLHALKAEHGLKASAPDKAGLVAKLAQRFRTHREAQPTAESSPASAAAPRPEPHSQEFIADGIRRALAEQPARATHGHTGDNAFFVYPDGSIMGWGDAGRRDRPDGHMVHSHSGEGATTAAGDLEFNPHNGYDIDILRKGIINGDKTASTVIMADGRMETLRISPDATPEQRRSFLRLTRAQIVKQAEASYEEARDAWRERKLGRAEASREKLKAFAARYGLEYRLGNYG